jgi:hypothetical protein
MSVHSVDRIMCVREHTDRGDGAIVRRDDQGKVQATPEDANGSPGPQPPRFSPSRLLWFERREPLHKSPPSKRSLFIVSSGNEPCYG